MRSRSRMVPESLAALGWIGLLALVAVACSEDEPPPQPGSFDRPSRVAFACFDVDPSDTKPLPLEQCESANADVSESGRPTHVLHALVVQSSRGEVAAVDLVDNRTVDSREDIPGYTFLPVGELPTAIVAPALEHNVDYTYVLSSGSRDVTVLRTKSFRQIAAGDDDPIRQTLQLPGSSLDAPLDMVLAPEEDALFVSIPSTGRLLRLPIVRCDPIDACEFGTIDEAGITELPLTASVARVEPPIGEPMSTEPYREICEYDGPISNRPLPVPPLPDDAASTMPRPSGLAIDSFCQTDQPCSQRLLVADAALPLIHVVDIAAWREAASDAAVLPPIATGAPTRTVAVTPRVPVDLSAESAETQYVYAIDANDGSVLVTQNGRLLEVGAYGARPDRITLGVRETLPLAVSLSVLTPEFDVHGPAGQYAREGNTAPACTDETHERHNNQRLRGVFLAVGVGDGTVRIIDVHDMDLRECRHCEKEARHWDPYPIVRHRARIAATVDAMAKPPVPLAPTAVPTFVSAGEVIQVRPNGSTSDPSLRGLACATCGERQAKAYPEEEESGASDEDGGVEEGVCGKGSARVCALIDPWADLDNWIASYRGVIPGTRGGKGRILQTDQGVRFAAEGGFCGLGVLGADQLEGHVGDQVAVNGELAPESIITAGLGPAGYRELVADACTSLVRRRDGDDPEPIGFTIREAFDGELVIDPDLPSEARTAEVRQLFGHRGNVLANDADLVNRCFGGGLLEYEVRVSDGYLVVGTEHVGFLHRVRAEDGSGRCVQDPAQDARRTGRAYRDARFDNGFIALQFHGGPRPRLETELVVGLQTRTPKSVMDASGGGFNEQVIASVPYDLRWSDTDDTLYMVDIASRGLLKIPVDPFPSGVSRSIQ